MFYNSPLRQFKFFVIWLVFAIFSAIVFQLPITRALAEDFSSPPVPDVVEPAQQSTAQPRNGERVMVDGIEVVDDISQPSGRTVSNLEPSITRSAKTAEGTPRGNALKHPNFPKTALQSNARNNPDGTGILTREGGAVKYDFWQNRSFISIFDILRNLDMSTLSPAYNRYVHKIIISTTAVYPPVDLSDVGSILHTRINQLIKIGKFDDAEKLISSMDPKLRTWQDDKLLAKILLVRFKNNEVCQILAKQSDEVKKETFWTITGLLCSAVSKDKDRLAKSLADVKTRSVVVPSGFIGLINYYAFDKAIDPKIYVNVNVWSLNIINILKFGIVIPKNLNDAFTQHGLLFNKEVDVFGRVKIAESMFANTGLDSKVLFSIYARFPKSYKLSATKSVKSADSITFLRIKTYKILKSKLDFNSRFRSLAKALNSIDSKQQRLLTMNIFAPLFKVFPPEGGANGEKMARLFYAVGEMKFAKAWSDLNKTSLWFERILAHPLPTPLKPIALKSGFYKYRGIDSKYLLAEADKSSESKTSLSPKRVEGDFAPSSTNNGDLSNQKIQMDNWIDTVVRKQKSTNNFNSGFFVARSFLILQSLGYKLTDEHWLKVSRITTSDVSQPQSTASFAKIYALKAFANLTADPLHILLGTKNFVNSKLDLTSFTQVINVMYRARLDNLARSLAYERVALIKW